MPNVEKLAIYENIQRYGHKFSLSALYLLNVLYEDIVLKHLTFKFSDTIDKIENVF